MAAVARADRRADSTVVWITFATFIGLGLASGLRGVAWPSMRVTGEMVMMLDILLWVEQFYDLMI